MTQKQQLNLKRVAVLVIYYWCYFSSQSGTVWISNSSRNGMSRHGVDECSRRSEQFDHALSGLSHSDPLDWNEKRQIKNKRWLAALAEPRPSLATASPLIWNHLSLSRAAHLALAGSPRWTECSSEPEAAAPRSSGPTRCCSTSRAASRNPHTPASTRPCWLQQREKLASLTGLFVVYLFISFFLCYGEINRVML